MLVTCSSIFEMHFRFLWGSFEDPVLLAVSVDKLDSSCFWEEEESMDALGEKGDTSDEDAAVFDAELTTATSECTIM